MSQMKRAKKAKAIKARKEKEKTKLDKLNEKIKKLQGSIKTREATKLGGAFKAQTDKKKKQLETLKLQKKTLTSPLPKSTGRDFETSKTNQPSIKSGGRDFEKPLTTRKKPVEKSSSNKKSGGVTPINTSPSKPKTETPKAGPAELGSQRSTKEKDTTIDKSAGRDSREDGIGVKIARALGDKRSVDKMISDRKESEAMEEEMNLRKGGAVAKKYGMREGGFTKRGGMYKKGYS